MTQTTTTRYLAICSLVTTEDEAIVLGPIAAGLPGEEQSYVAACQGVISSEVQLQ